MANENVRDGRHGVASATMQIPITGLRAAAGRYARSCVFGAVMAALAASAAAGALDGESPFALVLADANARHGHKYCGYELTREANALERIVREKHADSHGEQRQFMSELWGGTWACEAEWVAGSCMAARLQLCDRAFREYGPDGVLLPGLFEPIVRK